MFDEKSVPVLLFDHVLDVRLAECIEQYRAREELHFKRVDSDIDAFKGDGDASVDHAKSFFADFSNEKLQYQIEVHPLKNTELPVMLTISEESRRMEEIMQIYAPDAPAMPTKATLVLNSNSPIIQKLNNDAYGELSLVVAKQLYSLALLSAKKLSADEMNALFDSTLSILGNI